MQTVEIEDSVMFNVDAAAKVLRTNRAALIKNALEKYVKDVLREETRDAKVQKFIESYELLPQQPEEYEIWADEQVWDEK